MKLTSPNINRRKTKQIKAATQEKQIKAITNERTKKKIAFRGHLSTSHHNIVSTPVQHPSCPIGEIAFLTLNRDNNINTANKTEIINIQKHTLMFVYSSAQKSTNLNCHFDCIRSPIYILSRYRIHI